MVGEAEVAGTGRQQKELALGFDDAGVRIGGRRRIDWGRARRVGEAVLVAEHDDVALVGLIRRIACGM